MANPSLGGVPLIKAWMKKLYVGRSEDKRTSQLKAHYVHALARYKPEEPLDGPLRLDLVITYPRKKKHTTKKLLAYEFMYRTTRPDVDNASKIFIDALEEAGLVVDDARFARMVLEKRFGDKCGIQFRISFMPVGQLKKVQDAPFA